jgi:uncharacterized protein Smg (DUF494 family)
MFENVVEIIALIVSELRTNKKLNEINIAKLNDLGFTESEISTAFSWIVDRYEFIEDSIITHGDDFAPSSHRILHEAESHLFTTNAWGTLVELKTLGIINNLHIENIIERAMLAGVQLIDDIQLKSFIANLLFNANFNNNGSRIMLRGNDTIN